MPDQSPRTIATINFKGGVGKTTVTWCPGDVLSSLSNERVLMFDLDAQMSLTQAIALNEATGNLEDKFGELVQSPAVPANRELSVDLEQLHSSSSS